MAERLTDAQLDAIEDRARQANTRAAVATPGPWRAGRVEAEGKVWAPYPEAPEGPHGERCLLNMNTAFAHTDDRAFIAAARTDVPQLAEDSARLLNEVRRLRAERPALIALLPRCGVAGCLSPATHPGGSCVCARCQRCDGHASPGSPDLPHAAAARALVAGLTTTERARPCDAGGADDAR